MTIALQGQLRFIYEVILTSLEILFIQGVFHFFRAEGLNFLIDIRFHFYIAGFV